MSLKKTKTFDKETFDDAINGKTHPCLYKEDDPIIFRIELDKNGEYNIIENKQKSQISTKELCKRLGLE